MINECGSNFIWFIHVNPPPQVLQGQLSAINNPESIIRSNRLEDEAVFILCVTEDAGSDQKAQRLMLLSHICKGELESSDDDQDHYSQIWFFDISCLVHQFNLIVGSQLSLMDSCLVEIEKDYRYFSSLAKFIHSWRAMPSVIMAEFPPEQLAFVRLPPSPCAARWGCVHELEAFLLAIGVEKIQSAFTHACMVYASKRKKKANTGSSANPVDEIALDEYTQFQEKLGRYMRSASDIVKDSVFWFLVAASFHAKEPLISCYAWLQKPRETPMLDFTCGQSFEFLRQLQMLTVDLTWVTECMNESGATRSLTEEVQVQLAGVAIRMAIHNAAAYERRIYTYVTSILV